jgi:oligoribonuclease
MLGIFFDQETTGLDIRKHNVLEVAFRVVSLATSAEVDRFEAVLKQPQEVWDRSDPVSLGVNGFTWDLVCQGRPVKDIANDIIACFAKHNLVRGKAVFICQNPSLDRAFFSEIVGSATQESLNWPYHWLDLASMYWALEIKKLISAKKPLPKRLLVSKDCIAKANNLPGEERPHRAMQGVDHLLLCYRKVVGFPEDNTV